MTSFSSPKKKVCESNQEAFFFGLLKECINEGKLSEEFIREQMALNHVRHDAFEVLDRTPDLPPAPAHPAVDTTGQRGLTNRKPAMNFVLP